MKKFLLILFSTACLANAQTSVTVDANGNVKNAAVKFDGTSHKLYVNGVEVSGGSGLPSQTGNSGKYLTTNGTAASWGTIDLSAYQTKAGILALGGFSSITGSFPQDGLSIKSASANALTIMPTSNLTAGRTLSIVTGDEDRTISLGGDLIVNQEVTLDDWFDQGVKTTNYPTFTGIHLDQGGGDVAEFDPSFLVLHHVSEDTYIRLWNGVEVYGQLSTSGLTANRSVSLPDASGTLLLANGSGASLTFPGSLSIASGKTLTASNTLTLSGTDGASLAIGGGGTLGTAAYTSSGAYQPNDAALTALAAGSDFVQFTGPTTSTKVFTLPNASSTLLYDGGALGTPASGTVTNLTGTASININGTVGATTPNTGAFTTLTNTGAATNSKSGAASTPALTLSGVPFAGTGTTSFPLLYINDANATASTTLNTAGTYFGVNGDGTQDLMNLLKDGTSQFKVSSAGVVTTAGGLTSGGDFTAASGSNIRFANVANRLQWSTNGTGTQLWTNSVDGNLILQNGGGTGWGLLQMGGTTSSFPAIKRNGVTFEARLADDSGFAATQTLYDRFGSGSPESAVTAPVGAVYHRTDGGAGTSLYVKESGTGNTGWVAK